jgi:hypothetical protein
MSTPHQTETNRANSLHSTGPKTEFGKKKSSLNALRHGLTAQTVVLPTEDLAAYQLHVKSFTAEYNPQGATEAHLVQSLADTSWRLNRVAALETNLLTQAITPELIRALANLSLHSQRLSRQFERTVAQLRDLQKTRRAQQMQEEKGEAYQDGFVFSKQQSIPATAQVGQALPPADASKSQLAQPTN